MDTGSDLTLTFPRNKLGEFIGSLLGQQRKIERSFEGGHFVATHDWILNIIDIFEQRMAQNRHSLISFRCRFFFEDGRIHTVETIAAFRAYNDLSNKMSVGVDISVAYVVEFPGTAIPEKQEIRIEVFSDFSIKETASSAAKREKRAKIQYMVSFTNLTFGEDISRHISTYVETIYKRDWVTKALSLMSSEVLRLLGLLVAMLGGFSYLLWKDSKVLEEITQPFKTIENEYTLDAQSQKLNILVQQHLATNKSPMALVTPAVGMLIFMIMLIISYILLDRFNKSFVIFNIHTNNKSLSFLRLRVLT